MYSWMPDPSSLASTVTVIELVLLVTSSFISGGFLSMLVISTVTPSPWVSPSVRRMSTSPFSSTMMSVSGSYFSQVSPPSLEYSISYFPSGSTDSSNSTLITTSWLVGSFSDTSMVTFGFASPSFSPSPFPSPSLSQISCGIFPVLVVVSFCVIFPALSVTSTFIWYCFPCCKLEKV